MAEPQYQSTVNGQEVQQADLNLLGTTSGLSDDRVLAELTRLVVYDGTNVYKAIMPFATKAPKLTGGSIGIVDNGTVCPTRSANGSILIQPFRGIVGSRVAAGTSALQNWRDIRSAIFIGSSTSLAATIALAANASGNPRWDLVYATVTVDTTTANVNRKIKDPSSGAVTTSAVSISLVSTVSVTVLTGTPGATPVVPTLPADSGNTYNIPLAVVAVPTGFSATSTVSGLNIRDYVNGGPGLARIADLSVASGTMRARPANGNNDGEGTYLTNFPWLPANAVPRPAMFMPASFVGMDLIWIEIDLFTPGSYSHPTGSVVDSSMDWRNRFTLSFNAVTGAGITNFATKGSLVGTSDGLPSNLHSVASQQQDFQIGNTMGLTRVVYYGDHSTNPFITAGATVTLAASATTGELLVTITGTPQAAFWLAVFVSPQFPNLL
jgi:hypothetical protein